MSLDFRMLKEDKTLPGYALLVNTDETTGKEHWTPFNQSVAFAHMAVELGGIKPDNLDEWDYRLELWAIATDEKRHISREQLEQLAPLEYVTNVSKMTRSQFLKKIAKVLDQTVQSRLRYRPTQTTA